MKVHAMLTEIRSRLSTSAANFVAGAAQSVIDDIAVLAQRESIDAAVAAIEELSTPEPETERIL